MNLTIILFFIYLITLPCLSLFLNKTNKKNDIKQYFLSSGKVSFIPLFFTYYASLYSGETFIGLSGMGYAKGFAMLALTGAMLLVVICFWFFAPRLKILADKYNFITPSDFIENRYNYLPLKILISIVFIIVTILYILSNFKAIGYIIGHCFDGAITFNQIIIIMAIIMVIYECLGGMRSVIITDIIQGFLMLLGVLVIMGTLFYNYDFSSLISTIELKRPQFFESPKLGDWINLLSLTFLIGIGASIYPHIIQRVYCAQNLKTLKKTTIALALSPFFATFVIVFLGITAVAFFPELRNRDMAILKIVSHLSSENIIFTFFSSLFFVSILAAIMSTVDSASLTASSIIVNDFIVKKEKNQKKLIFFSRLSLVIMMIIVVILAIKWEQNIFIILKHKLSILIQISPAFFLGILMKRPSGKALFVGILVALILLLIISIWRFITKNNVNLFYINDAINLLIINLCVVFFANKFFKTSVQ